jgi:hypothetical protein
MTDAESFADLIRRARAGDGHAAEELLRQYEPQLRREVRLRLRAPRLRLGVTDVCPSVLLSFFARARLGQYDLTHPGESVRLLARLARKEVAARARKEGAATARLPAGRRAGRGRGHRR